MPIIPLELSKLRVIWIGMEFLNSMKIWFCYHFVQLLSYGWSLQLYGLKHARLLCSSLSPGVCSNSCPLSQWCHPTISSSVIPFFSCPQSFPESGSFPMSQLFASGDQNIGASASASVLPMNIQGWFPFGLTAFISLLSKGLSGVFFNTTVLWCSAFFMIQLSYPYIITGKIIALTIQIFVGKVMSLLLNMLSRFVIAFLSRSKYLLILWLQSSSSDFGVQENKICHCFHFFSIYLLSSDRTRYYDLSFLNVEF